MMISFSLTYVLVPFIRESALRFRFVDRPNDRKIHREPIPLMGGVAIYTGCLLPLIKFNGFSPLTLTILVGGTALLLVGLMDDWFKSAGKEFPVWPKIFLYLGISTIPLFFGIRIVGISHFTDSGMILFSGFWSWVATILWVFAITNMINFIDGMDGLAAGIVTLSSLTLLIVSLAKGQSDSAKLAAVLIGACLAFLAYNFHPAKIFMGDAGATFLGYTLAVVAVDGALKSATFISIFVPVLAIGVPILDTAVVFSRRLLSGKGLHRADKLHTHHTLMKWGLTQPQTVSFMYLLGLSFSLLAIIVMLIFS